MGKRSRYEPGTFCWVDLTTTDADATKAFYGELFGWQADDMPVGDGTVYTMMSLHGDTVCGLYEMGGQMKSQNTPPYWLSYVSVEDAAETVAKAKNLGGEILEEAFDIPGSGRTAVITDPTAATFALWQPKNHIGASRVNDPGCLTWNELKTRDHKSATDFYSGLFGWKTSPIEENGNTVYLTIENKGSMSGGAMPMSEAHGDAPPYWLPYFTVESCDDAVEKTKTLGGTILAGPMEPGTGRIAIVADPQGAVFAIFEGETDE